MENFEVIKPFGPSIVKIKMPNQMIDEMNSYVDSIINDEEKSKKLDEGSRLIGKVKQEFLMEYDFMKKIKWAEFLASSVSRWVAEESNKKIKHFELIKSWIVRQFKNDYNPVHWHSGHISGAGYLKVPSDLGKTTQADKKTNENGKLQLIYGSPNLLSKSTYLIKPEVGDFYLFPNYLMHAVYPFSGTDEERRSVSFNAKLDFIN
jgi:hypothetical protein|tara:strand:+ start:25 stop:639 length:615 start_codon:yes stop_codon:yes gene_type:complete